MAKRFLTQIDGGTASLTGRVTASAFAGDGSALTNLPLSTSSAFNNLSASGTASINNLIITSSVFNIYNQDKKMISMEIGRGPSGSQTVTDEYNIWLANDAQNSTGSNNHGNVYIGSGIAQSSASTNGSYRNVAIGTRTFVDNINGNYNVAIGLFAASGNISGQDNVAIGDQALWANTSGLNNVAIGQGAAYGVKGSDNVAIGNGAIGIYYYSADIASINNTTAIGSYTLTNSSSNTYQNTAFGYTAASAFTTGSYNVFIGSNDGATFDGLSNRVILSDGQGNVVLHSNATASTASFTGKVFSASFIGDGSGLTGIAAGGGVTQIIAGTNVTISPVGGTGSVTINATGGSGAPESDQNILAVAIFS